MMSQTIADRAANASVNACTDGDWQDELRSAFRSVNDLLTFLGLPPENAPQNYGFAFLVTRSFAQRMRHGDAADPLLRQVLPLSAEADDSDNDDFSADPLDESAAKQCDGVLQKYNARALVVATPACAIHCRYCFRRHFDYQAPAQQWWETARAHLAAHETLEEVILSGGDPLMLDNTLLGRIIADIEAMPRITRLRIHTRLPVVLPQRIDSALLYLLEKSTLEVVMVIHSNHAQELDSSVQQACQRIQRSGILVLNQSVLLRGINDSAATLADLSRALIRCSVMPYYIHAVDHVSGVQHFTVPDTEAAAIMRDLQQQVSGYMLPRLVREIPHETSKTILSF